MKFILFLFLVVMISIPVYGGAASLQYYLEVLDSHPKIEAIYAREQMLRFQAKGVDGLPDPTLFAGVDNVPVSDPSFDRYLPSSKVIGFSQSLPGYGVRKAQKAVILASVDKYLLLAEYTRSQLRGLFFTRLEDLERVQELIVIEKKKSSVIAQLREYYEGRIVAGDAILQKIFKADSEQYDVEQRLHSLFSEKEVIEADLIQLVGEVPLGLNSEHKEKIWNGDIASLYPVRIALGDLQIEEAKVRAADKNLMPDFGITASYKLREDGENDSFDGEDWFSLQVKLSIPLWASSKQLPQIDAARQSRKSVQLQHRDVVRIWQNKIARLQSLKKASSLNLETMKKKEQTLVAQIAAMDRTYSTGQTSLEPVLKTELERLSLLSKIAVEKQRHRALIEEFNTHITESTLHEK